MATRRRSQRHPVLAAGRWLWDELSGVHERAAFARAEQARLATEHAARLRQLAEDAATAKLWRANAQARAATARAEAAEQRARIASLRRQQAEAATTAKPSGTSFEELCRRVERGELRGEELATFLNANARH